jgi:hypothetical protein
MNEFLNSIKWIKSNDIEYVKNLSIQLNIGFLDVSEIFCLNGCQFYLENQYTYFDQNHWTQFGGSIFYKKLEFSDFTKKMGL